MSIPVFLSSSFYYFSRDGVVDVQTIMDDFAAQVLANVPVWTNPSGTVYKSPVDGYGRFFSVELGRVDATRMSIIVKDQNGIILMSRRLNIRAAGNAVRIYTGQFHCCIDVTTFDAEPEQFFAGILDLSPEPQNAHTRYAYCYSTRDSCDVYSAHWFMFSYMIDGTTVQNYQRGNTYTASVSGYATPAIDAMGYWTAQPVMFYARPAPSGDYRYAGRLYHTIVISQLIAEPGAEIVFPIDAGVTGTFRVIGGAADGNANAANRMVWACRVA
jgi:hypothetical protein